MSARLLFHPKLTAHQVAGLCRTIRRQGYASRVVPSGKRLHIVADADAAPPSEDYRCPHCTWAGPDPLWIDLAELFDAFGHAPACPLCGAQVALHSAA